MSTSTPGVDLVSSQDPLALQSGARKAILLGLFCAAQFLDVFNTSSLFSAIPAISNDVKLTNSQSVWLNSSYQLTFASFLLMSGRMADIYNTKLVFLCGAFPLGFFALGAGFTRNNVAIIVLRALSGIAASLTIPSSLNLIIHMFPDQSSQAKAVGVFGLSGAIGNVLGVVIGALFVTYASWSWALWFVAIVAFLVAISCAILIPSGNANIKSGGLATRASQNLDVVGVSTLTVALVLFIFSLTSGSVDGWGTATVIAPLVISVILAMTFFIWEARIDSSRAALPPTMWKYPNFALLIGLALLPYNWWSSVYLLYAWLWQQVYGWSAILTALHFLPIGLFVFPVMGIAGPAQQKCPLKWVLLAALLLMDAGTVMLPFGDQPSRYWPILFPAFCLGTAGTIVLFTTINIGIFAVTPPRVAGIVGAIFNCALQLSTAVGAAAITSIQTSVEQDHGGPTGYAGRAAGFWFLFATCATGTVLLLILYRKVPASEVKATESQISLAEQRDNHRNGVSQAHSKELEEPSHD